MPPSAARALVVSLHDVSPQTRMACVRVIEELRELGVPRTSLLVIPDHHHHGHFRSDPVLCVWLTKLVQQGHEVVMHGYYHERARQSGEGVVQKLTRVYTADEGEFYDLDREAARALVHRAREDFRALGLEPRGFIAPAWLLSRAAEQGLRDLECEYTTRLGNVLDLPMKRRHRSQSLVWSVRSAWRRQTSRVWNALLFRRLAARPLMRISIHPVDLEHPAIWAQIKRLIIRACADREVMTYLDWVQRQRAGK
jgi:predicted deacetylase